jgi:hypothetical protein
VIDPTPKVVAHIARGKTVKSTPKATVSANRTPVTKVVKAAKATKTLQPQVKMVDSKQSPIEEISDLLDNLPLKACVELTRRLLTSVPTLPVGPARSRAVLKIVILFVAEYGSTA